jgi:hypothetical protein
MSHNKNKVNAIAPNREGDITQSITDLSDVSLSGLTTGDLVRINIR